ncbi:hypothetical protein E2542_SST07206 [Spatholobus suberectus]|nr:hypothetical protein E2542_SST07206 [Spatholobus suberectus]
MVESAMTSLSSLTVTFFFSCTSSSNSSLSLACFSSRLRHRSARARNASISLSSPFIEVAGAAPLLLVLRCAMRTACKAWAKRLFATCRWPAAEAIRCAQLLDCRKIRPIASLQNNAAFMCLDNTPASHDWLIGKLKMLLLAWFCFCSSVPYRPPEGDNFFIFILK